MTPDREKGRRAVLVAVLVLVGLPPLFAGVAALSFHARNRSNGTMVSSGEAREYLLYVPASYDASSPTPLVISMHGLAGWPALQRDLSGWNRLADRHGFLVVYPAGIDEPPPRRFRVLPGGGLARDVRFIADLVDELARAYHVDPTRIYANGLSNGGGMAFALSCALGDRLAAVGMVAAAQTLPWPSCPDPRPMPMIAFHGTADRIVPYGGGTSWIGPMRFPDVQEWTARWARRNGCGLEPVDAPVAADVSRREYPDCPGEAAVVLYTVRDGGHTWPGGLPLPAWFAGATTESIDATELMWDFFAEHRLASPPGG